MSLDNRTALFRLIQHAMVALVKPNTGAKLAIQIRYEEAQLLVRLDGTSSDPNIARAVNQIADDPYILGVLDLIGATIQPESFSNAHRISFFLPIGSS